MEPKVGRLIAVATYTAGNWVKNELFNSIGTITISGTGQDVTVAGEGLFKINKTNVLTTSYKSGAYLYSNVGAIGEDAVVLISSAAPTAGDKIFITIEVYNLD